MKNKHQKVLFWYKARGCTLNCKINLDGLFETAKERDRFFAKWITNGFANRNVVCKLRDKRTFDFLKNEFGITQDID